MNNDSKRLSQLERIELHRRVLEKRSGKAVRTFNKDGYVNVLNKYGTSKDTSEHYHYQPEPAVPDDVLSMHYESNGLFAKIIDAPAEESVKHGFELEGISDPDTQTFFREAYDTLDLDNIFVTGNKWARLFGGAIGVIIADDGRGIDEPLDWKNIKSVEEVRIYDRSLIQPDYHSMFSYSPEDPYMTRGQKFGMPERYAVFSKYGTFTVHESRCLIFRNGILPEKCTNSVYQFWGMPEYMRLKRSMRDTELAYGSGPKMLDRSVQAIYKMKGLSEVLSAEGGDDIVLKRLEVIDMARGMLNSITIDSEGEDYDFKQFQFSGVAEIIDRSCAYLSALSNIPQSILFGAGAGGLSTTDDTSMENWYNYVERIQRNNNKANLRYLLSIVAQAGVYTGELEEVPPIKVKFNPLWSQSETEKVDIEQKRAQVQSTKAQTATAYVQMGAIDPSEVRRKLADDEEFNVETILDDLDENDLLAAVEGAVNEEGEGLADELGGNSPDADPAATKSEEELNGEDLEQIAEAKQNADDKDDDMTRGVGVLVVKDGKVLVGVRVNDFAGGLLCGPGGHAKIGETSEDAAIRETQEEFGITPTNLVFIGTGPREVDTGIASDIFLCTEYEGEVATDKVEMAHPAFVTLDEIEEMKASLFQPFADSIKILNEVINPDPDNNDGGPGSGFHDHEGREGKLGGSAPAGSNPVPYSGLSEGTKSLIEKRKSNPMGFGMSYEEKEQARTELVDAMRDSGATVSYNEDYDTYTIVSPKCSFEENATINEIANNGLRNTVSSKEYIDACTEAGTEPDFHTTKKEIPAGYLKGSDGTPVYQGLRGTSVLTNDELREFSSSDEELNPEGHKAFRKANEEAISEMTSEEASAVREYTSQYGAENYVKVNNYLNGSTPDDEGAKKAAELVTSALDHEIGAPTTLYRGDSEISHLTADKKVAAAFKKMARGDYSGASTIVEGLTGTEVESPVVTSTSLGGPGDYGKLPIQMIFKAPADTKGVDITAVSAYGGGTDKFSQMMGGGSRETEVALKPGMKYKIDRVDFSVTPNGKKEAHQIFLTCSIITDSTKKDSADETNSIISEKPIDKSAKTDIIKSKDISEDGGPGSGNFGHKGVQGQKGGSERRLNAKQKAKLAKRFVGQSTHDGVEIKSISKHAFDRTGGRLVSPGRIERMMKEGKTSPGNTENTRCYDIPGSRMVIDTNTGNVVSIMWRGGKRNNE